VDKTETYLKLNFNKKLFFFLALSVHFSADQIGLWQVVEQELVVRSSRVINNFGILQQKER